MAKTWNRIPATIDRYRMPATLLHASVESLRRGSAGVREAVILWQGRIVSETVADITKLRIPRQIAGPLHFNVPLDERLRLLDLVAADGEFILVQLHTHPQQAFHSDVDDRLAIPKHTGAISIVVADFAVSWNGDLLQTSVNRHLGGGRWQELSGADVQHLFEVVA